MYIYIHRLAALFRGRAFECGVGAEERRRGEGPRMWDVIVVASGLAIMEGKIREGERGKSCWMLPVPGPKLWWVWNMD